MYFFKRYYFCKIRLSLKSSNCEVWINMPELLYILLYFLKLCKYEVSQNSIFAQGLINSKNTKKMTKIKLFQYVLSPEK